MIRAARPQRRHWIEYAMGAAVAGMLLRAALTLYFYGELPQPFFYETYDTYMDWFNTAWWARDEGAYDAWRTIYPPLSFVVLRFLGLPKCYVEVGSPESRDCDWLGMAVIHGLLVVNFVLILWSYRKIDRATALPRAIALGIGMPMMYALERGNILLLCFTTVLLGYGPLLQKTRLRWIFVGASVNFKVYLIAPLLAQLLKRRWLWVEGALLSTIIIYLLSYGWLGRGTISEIVTNITDYSDGLVAGQVLDVWYPVTYQPLIALFKSDTFPTTSVLGSDLAGWGLLVVPLITLTGQVSLVCAAVAAWIRPEVVPAHRVAFLATTLALISSEAGGYTETMIILFVFMEPWRGIGRPLAIVCCYILCLHGDISVGEIPPTYRDSYLLGHPVEVHYFVGLGMFLRPAIVVMIAVALSFTTIRDVWADIRMQGWRDRWRFRRDWPLLPKVLAPAQPTGSGTPQGPR